MRDTSPEVVAPYVGELAKTESSKTSAPVPEENRIVIPSIGVNEPILEGSGIGVIERGGTWRRPNTVNPGESGNSVIVGHRYYGNDVSTFYHLDKVEVGQLFAVYWEGSELLYEVTETKIVDASAIEVEGSFNDDRLTLYTCHPIWTAKERLVVVAKPYNTQESARERQQRKVM